MDGTLLLVFVGALITALATGLGAIPVALARSRADRLTGPGQAIAAGLMLVASFSLIREGVEISVWRTAVGVAIGVVAIVVVSRRLHDGEMEFSELTGADARKALMIVGVMTAHSFAEGIGVGVSYSGAEGLGIYVTILIALHNIPEGLAISLVLVPRGVSLWRAAGWSIFSSLPQPLVAVPAYLFVVLFEPLLPVGLGLAAGAMVWMCLAEMLPDAASRCGKPVAGGITAATAAVMLVVLLLAPSA